jgi:type I restriction enzyme S subunit
MKSEWKEVVAEKYCSSVRDGTHDSPKQTDDTKSKYLITSKHLQDYSLDFENAYKISLSDYYKVIERSKVSQWDILFSMIGTIGRTYQEKMQNPDYAIKNIGLFKMGGNKQKSEWLKYYLHSPKAIEYIQSHLRGSTQSYVTLDVLRKMPITCPTLPEQCVIADTLSCMDDKIELNNKINANLEAQAQAVFKSWFVDFEPFQDGEFVASELGPIPKGWRVGTFSELIENVITGDWGKDSPTGSYEKQVYCIRGADIPFIEKGHKGKMPLRFILKKNFEKKKIQDGNLIIEISGGSPTQSTGRIVEITNSLLRRYDYDMVCTNFCKAISIKGGYSRFVYRYWKQLYKKNIMFGYENGTTGIKNFDFSRFVDAHLIIIPPKEIVLKFNLVTDAFSDLVYQNGLQVEILTDLRDSLLPKLMSGEITVPTEGN